MSTEIKVYLTNEQIEENLCFHSVIYSRNDYDLLYDFDDTYESLLIEALNGTLKINYFEKDSFEQKEFVIDNSLDYLSKVNEFAEFLKSIYNLTVQVEETFETNSHVGIRLVGAGFRGNPENPMLEHAQYVARNSMHGIKTALFPSNNADYINDDIYIKASHGSLKLSLEATKVYPEAMEFMRKVYNDIENSNINPLQFQDLDKRARYQTIIERLSNLNNQKRLKEFYIIINGEELNISNRKYLKERSRSIYNEEVDLIGAYQGYKKGSDSFILYIEGKGNYSCHLNKLSRNDFNQYSRLLGILKNINVFESNIILKVSGKKVRPRTINVTEIEIQ